MNYQVFVWIQSHENNPDLPNLDKSGLKTDGEEIEYDWVKDKLIVPAQLIDILCDQNNDGEADQDLDDDDNDESVELTNMVDGVNLMRIDKMWGQTLWKQGGAYNMQRAVSFVRHLLYVCFML